MEHRQLLFRAGSLAAFILVVTVGMGPVGTDPGNSAHAQSRRGLRPSVAHLAPSEARSHERAVREISDQDHARSRRENGQILPFGELLGRARPVGRGEYLGVEPNISNDVYRFKFMRTNGNVVWVDVDGRTGNVLATRK